MEPFRVRPTQTLRLRDSGSRYQAIKKAIPERLSRCDHWCRLQRHLSWEADEDELVLGFMKSFVHLTLARLARFVVRFGVNVRPLQAGDDRLTGLRIMWRADGRETLRGSVVTATVQGEPIRFFVANDDDLIQSEHRRGRFYEAEELAIIAGHFPSGGTFVDVGANVGNHCLYALRFLGARKVIAFEPQLEALAILDVNLRLNGLIDRVIVHPVGLAEQPGRAAATPVANNLGATRLRPGAKGGSIELVRGDDVLGDEQVDFVKIDTEGLELEVLAGLRETLHRCRPPLFVEIANAHLEAFEEFCAGIGYRTGETYRRYPGNINIVALPAESIG